MDTTKLARVIAADLEDAAREPAPATIFATVTAAGLGLVTLNLYGTISPGHRYATSYTPTAGDVVFCTVEGTDVVVLGIMA